MFRYKYTIGYVLSIVLVNIGFVFITPIPLLGEMFPPKSLIIAIASVAAFFISEIVDWAVYTYTKKPLGQRILLSSAIGTPIDSAVFLLILGFFSPLGFLLMTIAKMIAAVAIWWRLK